VDDHHIFRRALLSREPRRGGFVYFVKINGELIHEGWGAVGEGKGMTNNVAEYEGLLAAMRWAKKNGVKEKIVIKGDSQLVIKQIRGEWQVNSATSKRYVPEIKKLSQGLEVSLQWVRREENQEADELSRRAYREYQDLKSRSRTPAAKKK
jgi:ribonuclease HI